MGQNFLHSPLIIELKTIVCLEQKTFGFFYFINVVIIRKYSSIRLIETIFPGILKDIKSNNEILFLSVTGQFNSQDLGGFFAMDRKENI